MEKGLTSSEVELKLSHTEGETRAITFSALIIGNLVLILSSLSKTRSFFSVFSERNYAVIIIMVAALLLLFSVISIPVLQKIFSFEFPGYSHFMTSVIVASFLLVILEVVKYISFKRNGTITN